VLDEEFARIFSENFAGESGRTVTRRYNSYNLQFQSLYISKVILPGKFTYSGNSKAAMPVRARNSNWALIVERKRSLVNRLGRKFHFFASGLLSQAAIVPP
jgi:hypothetical protein